jgi:hypothetical protein
LSDISTVKAARRTNVPYRVASSHPDPDHPDHAVHQVGGLFDDLESAVLAIEDDGRFAPRGVPAEDRVIRGVPEMTTERDQMGYDTWIEELVPSKMGQDDNGAEIVVEHEWKEVK